MITRNDIGEAMAMLTGNAADKTPDPSEITILAWMDYFRPFPSWEGDDLVAAVVVYCRQPRERLVQPADLGVIIKAFKADELARMDPDDRAQAIGASTAVRRDRYGVIDKSVPDDDEECPADWTPDQRVAAYWQKIQNHRDQEEYEQAIGQPYTLLKERPASQEGRAAAVAAFANRQLVIDEEDPEDAVPYVNVVVVRCPFCKASSGQPCASGGGEKLTHIVAHPARITAAALAQGYTPEQAETLTNDHIGRSTVRARAVWQDRDKASMAPSAPAEAQAPVDPVDTSAERGERIAAAYASEPSEPSGGEEIPANPGGWRDKQGRVHFPDSEALDRAWAAQQQRLFGDPE